MVFQNETAWSIGNTSIYLESQQNLKSNVGIVDRFKKRINRLAQYHTNFAVKIVAVNYKGWKTLHLDFTEIPLIIG